MSASPTPAERVALRVAEAAAQTPASAYGLPSTIVFALGSAGLLMDPETAVELDEYRRQFPLLRARVAELEALFAAGAAAELRHQLQDPSEPPLECFMTGDICALAVVDAMAPHPAPCRFPSGPDCTCVPQAVTA